MVLPVPLLLLAPPAPALSPPIGEVLRRVAENQEKANSARARVVYHQSVHTRLLRGGGKVAREERRQYTVTPTACGTEKELLKLEGLYEKGGKLHSYTDSQFRHKGLDLDGELVESLTDDLVNDKKSRDGLSHDLFPLTATEQANYNFKFDGYQAVGGVRALRISFTPRKRPNKDSDDGDDWRPWSGHVLVHPEEFQPIAVNTDLGNVIPGWVKVVFGINLKQLGFSVTYRKVGDGLWFPATYGTEFGIRLFFGYSRTITMNLENTDFRFTNSESTITYENPGEGL